MGVYRCESMKKNGDVLYIIILVYMCLAQSPKQSRSVYPPPIEKKTHVFVSLSFSLSLLLSLYRPLLECLSIVHCRKFHRTLPKTQGPQQGLGCIGVKARSHGEDLNFRVVQNSFCSPQCGRTYSGYIHPEALLDPATAILIITNGIN